MKFYFSYLVFILCLTFLDGVKFRCDYLYNEIGWFKYHVIPATWRDARLMCQLEGGILASPTTVGIKSKMLDLMSYYLTNEIFTGIHATFSKGHYYSIDGIPLDNTPYRWAKSEPDNKNNEESCMSLSIEGRLSDVRCEEPKTYLCYRKDSNVEATICGTPDPEYHFESRTNKCYKFHTKPRSFQRAHFACSAEGGHLAIINNAVESKVISELYAGHLNKMVGNFRKDVAFIGFHNWDEGGDWRTIHGETLEEAGFAKFVPGNPNNRTAGEYCGSVLPSGLLNDLWCEEHYAFICEKSTDYPEICSSDENNNNVNLDKSEKSIIN